MAQDFVALEQRAHQGERRSVEQALRRLPKRQRGQMRKLLRVLQGSPHQTSSHQRLTQRD
jgi:hypothetical protein